jgi:hypothetical protein
MAMKRATSVALGMAFVGLAFIGLSGVARGDDKADPTGTWKWSITFNNQTRERTLKLKLEGEKLSGTLLGRNNTETAIEDATFKDGTVAFSVTRERNGQKFTTKYNGKLEGDTIKGKVEFERNGQAQSRDWDAKRDKT